LGKRDTKSFTISNTSVLPFKWQLAGAENLPAEFTVTPASGELAARSDVKVVVNFKATDKKLLSETMTLQVRDTVCLHQHKTYEPS
jgi:hydrocephalus-inducing protein